MMMMIRRLAGGTLFFTAASCAAETGVPSEERFEQRTQAVKPAPDFSGSYTDCDEFAGLGLVPLENVQAYVPEDFTVIEAGPGLALVVAQAGSCASIEVEGSNAAPGIFAQFGVAIVPPDGTGNGNFYQIMFSTNHQPLAQSMKKSEALARYSPQLSYQLSTTPDSIEMEVPQFPPLAWSLEGPIIFPNPNAQPNPTTVFNYWHQSKHFGNVLQRNTVNGIRLGDGQSVQLTALGAEMEAILGGTTLSFPIFSSPETFDLALLEVESNVF